MRRTRTALVVAAFVAAASFVAASPQDTSGWKQTANVKPPGKREAVQFGHAVAISADGATMAVGVPMDDGGDNAMFSAGAVYVFSRPGARWTQQAYLRASNREADDQFGFAVTLSADGNTLAVSAPFEDSNAAGVNGNQKDNSIKNSGAAYVFARTGNAWAQQAYVKA